MQLTDSLSETGVRAADPAALSLAECAPPPAPAPVNLSLYFPHESSYVLSHWFFCQLARFS
jgi:hypothetical protein